MDILWTNKILRAQVVKIFSALATQSQLKPSCLAMSKPGTVSFLMEHGRCFVPGNERERIRMHYGNMTIAYMDSIYAFNQKIGAPLPTGWASMMHYLNVSDGNIQSQFDKIVCGGDPISSAIIQDLFNIVQSTVRLMHTNERVWYTQSGAV
mgnify:CR=1 FL=1